MRYLQRKIFKEEYFEIAPWEEFQNLQLDFVINNMKVGQGKLFPATKNKCFLNTPLPRCGVNTNCISFISKKTFYPQTDNYRFNFTAIEQV